MFRSTGNNGASWNFPGRYTTAFFDPTGTAGVLEDKALMAVDASVTSPFRDRVYVTWTEFAADGTAYIYEIHSSDYGQTFSPRVLVSTDNGLCPVTFGVPTPQGNCNENQFSDPFTGPDGALYVAYSNFNNAVTGNDNRNQILLAKSTDGGSTFSTPVKVSDYYDLPDCDTYQGVGADPFRACVPEKGSSTKSVFRATNYASGAVNPTKPNQVVVTLGSYINQHSNESNGCVPAGLAADGLNLYTGVKTGGCNNDILVSVSTNGAASFTGTTTDPRVETPVTQQRGQATHRPVVAVGRVQFCGHARRGLLRPAVRLRRDNRLLGLQPVRQPRPHPVRYRPRHLQLHAAANPVRRPKGRPVLGRLHRPDRDQREGAPDLERHPGDGPVRLPGQCHRSG